MLKLSSNRNDAIFEQYIIDLYHKNQNNVSNLSELLVFTYLEPKASF